MLNRNYPAALTSYDLLKFTALLLMVVDHIGVFFFPEETWLRVMGRFSAPIWLFLIGYARSREVPTLLIGTLIFMASNFVLGVPIFSLVILGTMLICRLTIDPLMAGIIRAPVALYPVAAILFILAIPSFPYIEYGTTAMLFVMAGYMVRNKEDIPFTHSQVLQFAVIAAGLHALIQIFMFNGSTFPQKAVTGLGIIGVTLALTAFRPMTFESLTAKLTHVGAGIVKIGGRWSLEFYVVHLLLLKAYVAIRHPELFRFFDFHIF